MIPESRRRTRRPVSPVRRPIAPTTQGSSWRRSIRDATESSYGLTLAPVARLEIPATSDVVGSWADEHGVAFATARAEGPQRWIDWPGVGQFAFELGSTRVQVSSPWPIDSLRELFDRVLQPVIQQALGRQALHASAVVGTGGVLAFCGRSRSGKSTLAYALSGRGFRQIADDALLIDAIGRDVSIRALPFQSQLREPSRSHFGAHSAHTVRASRHDPIVASLRGVFILDQNPTADGPMAERLAPVAAFTVLLQHAHSFDQRPSLPAAPLVDDYLRIVERVPVFSLTYPPSFAGLDALVQTVVSVGWELGVGTLAPAANAG